MKQLTSTNQNTLLQQLQKTFQALLGLIVINLLFFIVADEYGKWETFQEILAQSVPLLIMAIGTTVVLISGGLDLSVGSSLALCTCVVGALLAAGVPVPLAIAAGLGAGGSQGTSYHSAYDTLAWYQKVVGADYESAVMVTRVTDVVLARLANAPLIPLDPLRYTPDFLKLLDGQLELAEKRDMSFSPERLRIVANDYHAKAESVYDRLLRALESDGLPAEKLACINERLLTLERHWITPSGLPEREWYKNLYAATDETSGYAACRSSPAVSAGCSG